MLDILRNIDESLLRFFNITLSNPIFDRLFPFITNVNNWLIVYVFLLGWMLLRGGKRLRIGVLIVILTVVISDQLNSEILKNLFGRLRPCKSLVDINVLINCGSGLSFPSSHAVNNFAVAFPLSYYFPRYRWLYFTIASMMAFSRVYVGVHYPFDILAGALLGSGIGYISVMIARKVDENYLSIKLKSSVDKL